MLFQRLILLIVLATFATFSVTASRVSYEGYKVYRLTPTTQIQLAFLKSLESKGVNFWRSCSIPGRSCDVLLSQKKHFNYLNKILTIGVKLDVFVEDLQGSLNNQCQDEASGRLSWDKYYRLADIYNFLNEQAANHSTIAEVKSIGKSFEGRDLNVIQIKKTPTRKPVIFVEANVHAREWITSSVATYLVNDLLNSNDSDVQKWTEDFDWYVLPVFNPDGFEYTHTNDRLWRKNRANTSSTCLGTDLNRNFDYNFGGPGSSPDPCQMTYHGSGPNSEPETAALTTFVETLSDDLVFYLSIHSYSQFILFSYGDKIDSTFYDSNMLVATKAAEALEARHGKKFEAGNWMDVMYASTGDSMDWAKSKLNVNLSLTFELRDTGTFGFILPAAQIIPSGEEFVDSLKPIIEALRDGVLSV